MAVTLDIDGSVEKITAKLRQTKSELEGVAQGYDDLGEASKKAVSGAASDQKKAADAAQKTNAQIGKQSTVIRQLTDHISRLEKAQKRTNNPDKIKKYNTAIVRTRVALNAVRASGVAAATGIRAVNVVATASTGIFTALSGTIAATFAPLLAAGAAVAGIREIISSVSEYEQTAADLSAITGASGDTLEFLKQSAVEVGIETTISAGKTLEAYKLIASAKPELLQNAEGLAQITREAITLTEAMGGELPEAATNLTDIMNQFNAPADEARRFVNALAAGSKEGSADVGQLASAILVSGTEMKTSNVQFEEGIGLLEALAEKGRKGSEAGTGLRNVLSKLSATELLPKDAQKRLQDAGVDIDKLSDKTLSFSDRLRFLKPIQEDANALTAIFGLENKATAQILIDNVDRVDELTRAVTGTNIATEQAATRTATLSGEWKKLVNTVTALIQNNGGGLNTFLTDLTRAGRQTIVQLSNTRAYLAGWFSFVVAGFAETGNNISDFAGGVARVISEGFNFRKLLTEGTGSLKQAISDFKTTEFFGDAGEKASEAFNRAFEANSVKPKLNISTGEVTNSKQDSRSSGSSTVRANQQSAAELNRLKREQQERNKLQEEAARARLAALADGVEKQLALEQFRFDDLKQKLDKHNIDSSQAIEQHELNVFAIKTRFLSDAADLENLSGEERIQFLFDQTSAEIDAIESALAKSSGGKITEQQQKQINLLRKRASEDYLKQIGEFQNEETEKSLQHEIGLLELKRDQFSTQLEFEEFKEKEILDIRLRYAEAQLALLEKTKGAEDNAALALRKTINEIKGALSSIEEAGGSAKKFSLYSLFGLDPSDPEGAKIIAGINKAASTTTELLGEVNKQRLESVEANIEASKEEIEAIDENIEAKERELETQIQLGEDGFANNQDAIKSELELLKQRREQEEIEQNKALEQKKKIQKQQAIIDTITQGSSLITASAQIFQSVAAIPFVGPVLGAALVAGMLGSFAAAKSKVFSNISKQKAERGMHGIVSGKRHGSGGERFGDHIEVEQGEAFGVLSRKATSEFGSAHAAFVNAANRGDKSKMISIAASLAGENTRDENIGKKLGKKEAKIVRLKEKRANDLNNKELKESNALLKKLISISRPGKSTEYSGGKKIIRSGNTTRIVKTTSNG